MESKPLPKTFLIIGIVIVVLLHCVVTFIVVVWLTTPDYPFYTDSVEDYNSDEYYFDEGFFMPDLPRNAQVVAYSSYNYWNEDYDQYLEVRFDTKEEMDGYISALFGYLDQRREADGIQYSPDNGDWFLRETNPYDSSFVDCYYKKYRFHSPPYYEFTGYRVEEDLFDCHYCVISYSYESLTVIQSECRGTFYENENEYTPKFLERFGINESARYKFIRVGFDY